MKEIANEQKGITLVALVVTIVVLIILSGVSISLVLGNNGIVTKAMGAKSNYTIAQGEEQNILNNASDWIDTQLGGESAIAETVPYIPDGCTQISGTSLKNGLSMQDAKGNQYVWVVVPRTSTIYNTAGLGINNFSDENYNKIENDLKSYTSIYRKDTDYSDTWYSKDQTGLEEADYNTLKKQMLKSIYQNGGFWVGKYEVGDGTLSNGTNGRVSGSSVNNTPVIKENQMPYTYVSVSQSENLAKKLSPNSSKYNTDLLFGVQWDLVLSYFESKGTSQADLKTQSTSWGNYEDSDFSVTKGKYISYDSVWAPISGQYHKAKDDKTCLSTGITDRNSKQGIYDIAGGVWEWTFENKKSDTSKPCTQRGGSFYGNGQSSPVSSRVGYEIGHNAANIGFRTCLYVK